MKHYRTSKYLDTRIELVDEIVNQKPNANISVDTSRTFQEVLGFGGAFTEASAYNLSRISKKNKEKAIKAYFDPVEGLGYNLGRVSIHSSDFSLGSYSYVEDYDKELKTFSIDRDKWLVIPLIKDAQKYIKDDLLILGSPWSPVWWMKDNKSFVRGGHLLKEYYDTWAKYYTLFIREYEKQGIPIWGISVQNEPQAVQRWDSCIYSGEEERDFVKNHLGPTMEKSGYQDKKILIWDHNRDLIVERAKAVLEDLDAAKYVWGTAFHWYGPEDFSEVGKTHQLFPDKHLLFTEGCQEGGPHFDSWETGERYGRNMIGDFNNYVEGYIDWNLFLDDTGGPNHVNNLCDAPVMMKIFQDKLIFQSSYYYIGHFSKFIKRGAKRVNIEVNSDLLGVAFINPDKSIVVIVQNQTENEFISLLEIDNQKYNIKFTPRSISTIIL